MQLTHKRLEVIVTPLTELCTILDGLRGIFERVSISSDLVHKVSLHKAIQNMADSVINYN